MMCDVRLWAPQVARFESERTVQAFVPAGGDTMEAIARTILAQAPERFALAGLSLGGIVAMEMLRLAPERIERLALLDTNHLPEGPERHALRRRQIADARSGRLAAVMRDEMKPNYLADGPNRGAILDLCMAMALDLGADVFEAQSHALMHRRDQSDTLAAFRGPALVMCGAQDALCPPARHDEIAALMPDADRVTAQGAGHLVTLEAPDTANEALARWLRK